MLFIHKFFVNTHQQVPLGRWISVILNHDILEIKYKLKKNREILIKNNIDPYELNKNNKNRDHKDKLVSNLPFIDW